MNMAKNSKTRTINWRLLIGVAVSVMAFFFIYTQRETIKRSVEALASAEWYYVLLAVATYSVTVVAAAAVIYKLRFVEKMKYAHVLIVQTSTLFLGRITPASVGGLAAMGRVLFTQGHTVVQSGTIVAAGGIATFLGNVSLMIVAVLFSLRSVTFGTFQVPRFIVFIIVGLVIITGCLLLVRTIRARVKKALQEIYDTLKHYRRAKGSVAWAVFFGAIVTLCFALTLMLVAKSLGVTMSLLAAIITVSLGSLGVAVTPLPGGVVGAEAALAATMVQFGVPSDVALAIAFVYRFIIFWLPLLPGYIASQYALKKQLL